MDLSVIIPARNEMFLANTIRSVLENMEGHTEAIVVLDGYWPDEPLPLHPRLNVIRFPESVGQRAATNAGATVSRAKYVMKLDAHCAVGPGFDTIMMEDMQPDWTMVPLMYNLHVWDWVCAGCGHRTYQGPTPEKCAECGHAVIEREMVWKAKPSPKTTAMRFDRDLRFQYWSAYKKRQEGDLVETMSLLGACWMIERERYHELNICDEEHGSWGQQGTEVALASWLSGGKLICNKRTWFAHMFRSRGDFSFPYKMSGRQVERARVYSKKLWNAENPHEMPLHPKATHTLSWLIDKFAPVPDWEDLPKFYVRGADVVDDVIPTESALAHLIEKAISDVQAIPSNLPQVSVKSPSKGIVYYTDGRLDSKILRACQAQLEKAGLPIVAVSLDASALEGFGDTRYLMDAERGPETMFRQILEGIRTSDADIIYLAEHDVLYDPSHFDFSPGARDVFYYNNNIWQWDFKTGRSLFHYSNRLSQLCAHRELLLEHYRKRVAYVSEFGYSRRLGHEPGTHNRVPEIGGKACDTWMSVIPNVDIKHEHNLTRTRWKKEQFRNARFTEGWTEGQGVPGWEHLRSTLAAF